VIARSALPAAVSKSGSDQTYPHPPESHSGSLPRGDQHWRPASYFHETLTIFLQIITEEAARFQPAIRPEKSANRRLTESFHNRCRRLNLIIWLAL
jgi:hypothetical protein